MTPEDVLKMPISFAAKVVFSAISMLSKGGDKIAISCQVIGNACGASRPTVIAALTALERAGLIRKAGSPVEQVQPYEILHPRILHGDQKRTAEVRTISRKVQLLPCAKCAAACVPNKAGWCRKCAGRIELTGFVRREINGAFAERGMGLQEKLSDHKTA